MPIVLLIYAVPYVLRARALRRAGRPVAHGRVACFAAGLLVLAVAGSGPVGRLADRHFSAHMAEHLALGDLAPLLLVLGCSGPLLAPLLRTGAARALRWAGHPAAALTLWVAALYAWHLPGPYDLAARSGVAHAAQHASFFAGGLLVWGALLGPLPKPSWFTAPVRLGYVTAVWLLASPLGAALAFGDGDFYATYPRAADVSAGGAIMLAWGTTVAVCLFCWQFLRLFDDTRERQELTELATATGVPVAPARVERAVGAGAQAALRRRIAAGREPDA